MKHLLIIMALMIPLFKIDNLYGQCNNTFMFPNNIISVQSGTNVITTAQYAGDFNVTTGYKFLDGITFTSSVPTDIITIRTANGGFLLTSASGSVGVLLTDLIDLEMHINTAGCGSQNSNRTTTIEVSRFPGCDHNVKHPELDKTVKSGINVIANDQFAGEYNVTNGYTTGDTIIFRSSNTNDLITLRRDNDNEHIISGYSPLEIIYNDTIGYIEMHVSVDNTCLDEQIARATSVELLRVKCNNGGRFPLNSVSIKEGLNIITPFAVIGTYVVTKNYPSHSKCTFSTPTSNAYLSIKSVSLNTYIEADFSPLTLEYKPEYGDLEIHINLDGYCDDFLGQGVNEMKILVEPACSGETMNPTNPIISQCGTNKIADLASDQYCIVSSFSNGETLFFKSPNESDYIYVRTINDSILAAGPSPLQLTYNTYMGNLKVNISFEGLCVGAGLKSLILEKCVCRNSVVYPEIPTTIACGINVITNEQFAGDYNITFGYEEFSICTFQSTVSTDFITIRSSSDGNIIAYGQTPLTLIYRTYMGELEFHLNSTNLCGIEPVSRTTSINVKCPCFNSIAHNPSPIQINCGPNVIASNQADATYNQTTGYKNGSYLIFSSSNTNDNIVIRESASSEIVSIGRGIATLIYKENMGSLKMDVNATNNCTSNSTTRQTNVEMRCGCYYQYNTPTISNLCIFPDSFYMEVYGSMNFSHPNNTSFDINAEPGDYITIYNSDNNELIATGTTSLSLPYVSPNKWEITVSDNNTCPDTFTLHKIKINRGFLCNDIDNDDINDDIDNCVNTYNPNQEDTDQDGRGDICDIDVTTENNVGIGTNNPKTKLEINGGNVFVTDSKRGVVMKSQNGTCWQLKVENTGQITSLPVPCPDQQN